MFSPSEAHIAICNIQDILNDKLNLDIEEQNSASWLCVQAIFILITLNLCPPQAIPQGRRI